MIKGIDNVGVAVTNLARSLAFYEKLGFTKSYDYEAEVQGCAIAASGAVLFLFQTKQANPQLVKRDPSLARNPPGLDHISFVVEDVDAIYNDLKAKGIEFNGAPADQDWGARLVGLKDPDGNNLYFLKYLG
jgi:catechol 2,3-dioxygenase-like lactoylglutathione lyase family enzyme